MDAAEQPQHLARALADVGQCSRDDHISSLYHIYPPQFKRISRASRVQISLSQVCMQVLSERISAQLRLVLRYRSKPVRSSTSLTRAVCIFIRFSTQRDSSSELCWKGGSRTKALALMCSFSLSLRTEKELWLQWFNRGHSIKTASLALSNVDTYDILQ